MEQVLIAVIGTLGIVVPTLLSTRLGKWRILHLIQEESKAHAALPENLKRQRAALSQCIAHSVRDYEERRGHERTDSAWTLAATSLWVSFAVLLLSLNVLSDAPLTDPETWEPLVKALATGIAIGAAVIATMSLALLALMIVATLARFGPAQRLMRRLVAPLARRYAAVERFRAWAQRHEEQQQARIPEE